MAWTPSDWRKLPAQHIPQDYPDTGALAAVENRLRSYPPLVFAGEARRLKTRLAEVAAFLCERLARAVSERPVLPELGIDGSLAVGAANVELLAAIERLGPFGVGNAEPRFVVSGARVVRADVVGADHVRCILAGGDGARLKAIAFRAAGEPLGQALTAGTGRELHLAGKLRMDRWQGAERAQLIIEDAAPAQQA